MSLVGVGEVFLRDNRVYHVEDLARFGGLYKPWTFNVLLTPSAKRIDVAVLNDGLEGKNVVCLPPSNVLGRQARRMFRRCLSPIQAMLRRPVFGVRKCSYAKTFSRFVDHRRRWMEGACL